MSTTAFMAEILLIGIIALCGTSVLIVALVGEAAIMDEQNEPAVVQWSEWLGVDWWLGGPVLLSVAYVYGIATNTVGRLLFRWYSRHAKLVALLGVASDDDWKRVKCIGGLTERPAGSLKKLRRESEDDALTRFATERAWWFTYSGDERKNLRKAIARCFRRLRAYEWQSEAGLRMLNEQRGLLRVARGAIFGLALGTVGFFAIWWNWTNGDITLIAGSLAVLSGIACVFSFIGYFVRQLQSDRYLISFLLERAKMAPRADGTPEG
jgi:hypothetical protein